MAGVSLLAFAVLAAFTLCGAVATVLSRDAARTALALLVTALGSAGCLAALSDTYLAAVGVIVLGAAVPTVLFASALRSPRDRSDGSRGRLAAALAALAALALASAGVVALLGVEGAAVPALPPTMAETGRAIFVDRPVALALATAVLLTAIVAAAGTRGGSDR